MEKCCGKKEHAAGRMCKAHMTFSSATAGHVEVPYSSTGGRPGAASLLKASEVREGKALGHDVG